MTKKLTFFFLIVIMTLLIASCTNGSGDMTATLPAEAMVTDTPQPTETPQPTNTPAPSKLILYAPAEASANLVNEAQTLFTTLAGESGLVLDVRMTLTDQDVDDTVSVLVVLDESGIDAVALANQHPAMKVIVLRNSALESQPANLVTVVEDSNVLTFAAGYVSILAAPDWRLAGLLPWDDETSGAETMEAFDNGASYLCGRCNSTYMPVTSFPVASSLPSNSSPDSWIEQVTSLHAQYYLYTVFVSKEAASTELYQHLSTMNVVVIGEVAPEGVDGLLWGATITQDPMKAIQEQWGNILGGTLESNELVVPVTLTDINEDYLSTGRQRLYDEMMENLTGGWVSPLSPEYP